MTKALRFIYCSNNNSLARYGSSYEPFVSGLRAAVCHKTVNWVSSEWFKWLVIRRNGKSIAPFHRLLVSDFSFKRVAPVLCLQGQVFQSHQLLFLQGAPVRAFRLWVLRASHIDSGMDIPAKMHWVTHGVRVSGCLGFVRTLWLSYEVEWEGGICFQTKGGYVEFLRLSKTKRWKTKQNKDTELGYSVRM